MRDLQEGRATEGRETLRKVLADDPEQVKARLALASSLVSSKEAGAAADVLTEGLMLLPTNTALTLALAQVWAGAGKQDDALTLLRQNLPAAGNDGSYHAMYARLLQGRKQYKASAEHFRIALRERPEEPSWLVGLGLSLHDAGERPEAQLVLKRALATGKLAPQLRVLVEQLLAGAG